MEAIKLKYEELSERESRRQHVNQQLEQGIIPENWVTGDEFVRRCTENITTFYKEYGLV